MPEIWDMGYRTATAMQYPLRPGMHVLWFIILAGSTANSL